MRQKVFLSYHHNNNQQYGNKINPNKSFSSFVNNRAGSRWQR
jgi:hypothetical protein